MNLNPAQFSLTPRFLTKSSIPAFLLGVGLQLAGALHGQATVNLVNGSFESNNVADSSAALATPVGWNDSVYILDNGTAQNRWFTEPVPDGLQVITLSQGKFTSQALVDDVDGPLMSSAAIAMNFDIEFYVGRRSDSFGAVGNFSVHLQDFNGGAYVGNYAVQAFNTGGDDGNSSTIDLNIPQGTWMDTPVTLRLTVPAGANPGHNIRLTFANAGAGGAPSTLGECSIDNVKVTFVPEPASTLLGGIGLLGLMLRRRR